MSDRVVVFNIFMLIAIPFGMGLAHLFGALDPIRANDTRFIYKLVGIVSSFVLVTLYIILFVGSKYGAFLVVLSIAGIAFVGYVVYRAVTAKPIPAPEPTPPLQAAEPPPPPYVDVDAKIDELIKRNKK